MPGEVSSPGTEIQIGIFNRQGSDPALIGYAALIFGLVVAAAYTLCCFSLGFRTRGVIAQVRSIPQKLSPKKLPLKEGPYPGHGPRRN